MATAAGFGGLTYYLIVKHLPAQDALARKEREQTREYLERRDERLESIVSSLAAEQLPERLDSIEERLRRIDDALRK